MKMTLRALIAVGVVAAGISLDSPATRAAEQTFAEKVYRAFQTGDLDRWDELFHEDVVTNSSAAFGVQGRDAVKAWARQFLTAFAPRIDLVDQINAIDGNGDGRAVATLNLNWTHVAPFYHLEPSGRSGTSVENLIMTIEDGMVVRMEVADTTLDLVIYLHERGWVFPQGIRPVPIVRGIERAIDRPVVDFTQ